MDPGRGPVGGSRGGGRDPGSPPSHLLPRSRRGRIALIAFAVLFALVQPPVVHRAANRVEPWIFGLPFLFVYLLVVYSALIGVLVWAAWRDL